MRILLLFVVGIGKNFDFSFHFHRNSKIRNAFEINTQWLQQDQHQRLFQRS